MKFGDNMAPVEACTGWKNRGPKRSRRPPKIGDIPRRSAIDEGSPSSGSPNLTSPIDASEGALGTVLDAPSNETFETRLSQSLLKYREESSEHEGRTETDRQDSALCEDIADEEEYVEELEERPAPFRPLRVQRPRRESSGYASNLGTFDDDLTQETGRLRERRRSSTKRPRIGAEECDKKMPTTELLGKFLSDIDEAKEIVSNFQTLQSVPFGSVQSNREDQTKSDFMYDHVQSLGSSVQDLNLESKLPQKPPLISLSSESGSQSRLSSVDDGSESSDRHTSSSDSKDTSKRTVISNLREDSGSSIDESLRNEPETSNKLLPRSLEEEDAFALGKLQPLRMRSPTRKLSSPGDVEASVRQMFSYCSPYGSPQGSPGARRRISLDYRQDDLQLGQYKLLETIGQGSYGIVKLVYNVEDETNYAMKILSKRKLIQKAGIFGRMAPGRKGVVNPLEKVYQEIALLKKLDHPNVVKFVEVLDDSEIDYLYLVFEYVQKGEVIQLPTEKPLDEDTAWSHFRDVIKGVEYLHYQRIVHRDIKPSNLLVDSEGRVKVADLGVSAELPADGELLTGFAGTPAFAAPETMKSSAQYLGTPCDIWSMGATLYSLVFGKVPWDGSGSIIEVQKAICSEPLKFPDKPTISDELRDLISRMLEKDPADRISLPEIKHHRWVTKHGTHSLPSEEDNCPIVTVTKEDVERVANKLTLLSLILVKTMIRQHSFQNPFQSKQSGKAAGSDATQGNLDFSPVTSSEASGTMESKRKAEAFYKSGRSLSAPDRYEWQTNGRQMSVEKALPPVEEAASQETDVEKR